jgi:hypothetical protein
MSLKAFHIFFIVVSIALAVGFGVWCFRDYSRSGDGVNLALGVASFIGSVSLAWYGVWFLRKLKNESFL